MRFADTSRNMDVELALFMIQLGFAGTKGLVARTGDIINAICTGEPAEMLVELHIFLAMAKSSPALMRMVR
jgi:hypothetical protein